MFNQITPKHRNQQEDNLPAARVDVVSNKEYFDKMLAKVKWEKWHPADEEIEVKIEIQKNQDEPLNALFVHGRPPDKSGSLPERKGVFVICFNQTHREFRLELCNILNWFGSEGKLTRLDKPKPKQPIYNEWNELFPK